VPGPLAGFKVVQLAGIGPSPFTAMMLADMGADVLRIDRLHPEPNPAYLGKGNVLGRGQRSVGIDLKAPAGREAVLRLVSHADALTEGFRPGVVERLGLGPDDCLARNPRLVYGRMTGWGQDGPYSAYAGHDINYMAISGTLSLLGRAGEVPSPPVNLLGDFGGGGMLLAYGIVCALLETSKSGVGQVIDANVADGAGLLAAMVWGLQAVGSWSGGRGGNRLDSGAWYYEVYETSDGKFVSIGALEPQFYAEMVKLTGLSENIDQAGPLPVQTDSSTWAGMKDRMTALMKTRTRAEWCALMEGTDACFAPVLELHEAPAHPHNRARNSFVEVAGVMQPAPAPRFSRTPAAIPGPPPLPGQHTKSVLADWGFDAAETAELIGAGVLN
jgi:alpha-methylacyl-CoA racemase